MTQPMALLSILLLVTMLSILDALQLSTSFKFSKYQGLGNDFILIDNTKSTTPILSPEEGSKLCDRNFGVGGDGVIFVMPGTNNCDYTMRIYNPDGSEPQMCGNGIRCMAKYIYEEIEKKDNNQHVSYNIWTGAGKIIPQLKNGEITVDMGIPILKPELVPTLLKATKNDIAIDATLSVLDKSFKTTCVSMGNPHAIIFFDDVTQMQPSFNLLGPAVENHPMFPQRINAHFVQVLSRSHLLVKTWERGAGPTLACGTGKSIAYYFIYMITFVVIKCRIVYHFYSISF